MNKMLRVNDEWYTIDELKELVCILETQMTTDKLAPGTEAVSDLFEYHINENCEPIIDKIR